MATLINGNGNPRIYAAQDADLIAALDGDITGIAQIGNKFAATAVDAYTISVADGVIVTKEGRRIQLDAGSTDMFVIPTGTTGVTNYYIIGYKLTTQSDDSQIAETFVQLMSSSSETITEDTFRAGATDVYVSLYRVQQDGVNLGTITGLLPELTNISELKSDLPRLIRSFTPDGADTYTTMLTKIADYIKGLNLEVVNINRLVLMFNPSGSTKRLFSITKYNDTNGYYSFEAVNNGLELQACSCHMTGSGDVSKFTHLVFNTGNSTWTYSEDTSATAAGRTYELYFV